MPDYNVTVTTTDTFVVNAKDEREAKARFMLQFEVRSIGPLVLRPHETKRVFTGVEERRDVTR